nr:hypothetical protein [uncultured Leptotrichia sp.]
MKNNNETIGISAEVAIAKAFDININPEYALRADNNIVNLLSKEKIVEIFNKENIPNPIEHIAEDKNPIDFKLFGNKSLSVKTNKNNIGKASPQNIGQPTDKTYFEYLKSNNIFPSFDITEYFKQNNIEDNYENRGHIFKKITIEHIDCLINMYWKNIFDCDYLILLFNLENGQEPLHNYKVWGKSGKLPNWNKDKFNFTKGLDSWNESTTLKYENISIGEFQVHNNRNCFKFRFNMKGIVKLIDENLI